MKKLFLSISLFSFLFQPVASFAEMPIDTEMLEINQQALDGYRELYEKNIADQFSNIHSGFSHQYQIKPNEDSFYSRITRVDVEFYASLATLIYANDANTMDSIVNSIQNKLNELHRTGYEFLGLMKRSGNEHSAGLFYNKKENHVVLVYAGTKTTADFITDAKFLSFSGEDKYGAFMSPNGKKLSVHNGFAKAYLEGIEGFVEKFTELLGEHKQDIINNTAKLRVTTTGHSLGGALSTLAANDMVRILRQAGLASKPSDFIIENMTFASPRVFNPESAEIVERTLGGKHNIIAFRDLSDPVPMVPPSWTSSKHVGTPFYIGKSSVLPIMSKHFMVNYIDKVGPIFDQTKKDAEYRQFVESSIKHYKAEIGDTTLENFQAYEALNALKVRYDEIHSAAAFFKGELSDAKKAKDKEKISATEEILDGIRKEKKLIKKNIETERKNIKKLLGIKPFQFFNPSTWF